MNKILLTGATGNIGSRILVDLLEQSSSEVVVLVRADSQQAGLKRILEAMHFWGLTLSASQLNRIVVLQGDIAKPFLGLPEIQFRTTGNELTHIIHCASTLRFDWSLQQARHLILQPTKTLVDLVQPAVRAGHFVRFCYMSTMEVSGNLSGVVEEKFLSKCPRTFLNTYEQAKAECEELLESAGIPLTVYRPTMVAGDSRSGKILHFQSFYYLMKEFLLAPSTPFQPYNPDFLIDSIPVDAISKTVLLSYEDRTPTPKLFHLTIGQNLMVPLSAALTKMERIGREQGIPIKKPIHLPPRLVALLLWLLTKATWGRTRKIFEGRRALLKFLFLKVRFDNSNTRALFEKSGVPYPEFDSYLPILMNYFIRTGLNKNKEISI